MQAESWLMLQRPSSGCLRMWTLGDRVIGARMLAATGQAGLLEIRDDGAGNGQQDQAF